MWSCAEVIWGMIATLLTHADSCACSCLANAFVKLHVANSSRLIRYLTPCKRSGKPSLCQLLSPSLLVLGLRMESYTFTLLTTSRGIRSSAASEWSRKPSLC